MAALDFPSSPTVGQVYTANGKSWQWDGVSWISYNTLIAAGSNTQIQFNNSGAFGASAGLTWNGTTLTTTGLNNTGNTTLGDASGDTLTINAGTTTFAGTGQRITGDFSNATIANRLMFQSSTANSITSVTAVPSGNMSASSFVAYGLSDPSNSHAISILALSGGEVSIRAIAQGTGTYLPMTFYTGGREAMRIGATAGSDLSSLGIGYTSLSGVGQYGLAVAGNVGIGTTNPTSKLHVFGELPTGGAYFQDASSGNAAPVVRVRGERFDSNGSQCFSGGLVLERYSSGGTISNGNMLGTIYFGGNYSGASFGYAASISAVASGNWSSTSTANTDLAFLTGSTAQTALGTANVAYGTERLRIASDGSCVWKPNGSTSAMTLDASGRLIIGDTSSSYKLKVVDTASTKVQLTGSTTQNGMLFDAAGAAPAFYVASGNGLRQVGDKGFVIYDITSAAWRFYISETGTVAIQNLAGSGSRAVNADANGFLSAASDSRLKQEAKNVSLPGLAEVLQLQPKAYKWLKDIEQRKENAVTEVGFFADEVAPIIPSAAPLCEDGMYGLYDRSITAALVKAIQELTARLETLEQRIN